MALEAAKKYLITDIISKKFEVPANLVRPEHDRPNLHEVKEGAINTIPIIDLKGIDGPDHPKIIDAIRQACEVHGFFMVINHGIAKELVEGMLSVGREFFHLPESERRHLYSEEPWKNVRLGTSFNRTSENVQMWRDALKVQCHPIEEYINEWPTNPPNFRDVAAEYAKQVRELGVRITELISESLGLEKTFLEEAMGGQLQTLSINYYPPCPQPDLALGLNSHTDPNSLTVLLQDEISGLEVLRDGKWVAIHPVKDALTINIGDQIQVLSNDKYISSVHRVTVNSKSERLSIPIFLRPSDKIPMRPAEKLVDDKNPAVYRPYIYKEYFDKVWSKGLNIPTVLDCFKIEAKRCELD
ncbi:hypothetical protein LUZ60_016558 [Juncus effusus]|nr:hypothetical protein LUZ60_016558 [Juncus effusus]